MWPLHALHSADTLALDAGGPQFLFDLRRARSEHFEEAEGDWDRRRLPFDAQHPAPPDVVDS
jgi:hypothetical protein